MNKASDSSIILEIEQEYKNIRSKWLKLHYKTLNTLVIFCSFVELILGISLYTADFIEISLENYLIKYILIPIIINLVFILMAALSLYVLPLKQGTQIYFVSLLYIAVCFVYYSVHSLFGSLYLIFTLPIMLTIVYSDYLLTTVTAVVSISAKIISEHFVVWDPDKVKQFDTLYVTDFFISVFVLVLFYGVSMIVIRYEKEKNSASINKEIERCQMQKKIVMDELTKVYNRTALRKAFHEMEEDQSDNQYIFVMIDVDQFKQLNDTCGHEKGDQFLEEFGEILKNNFPQALPVRYGGDEFCVLCKNMELEDVVNRCKSVQKDVERCAINQEKTLVTVSFGIAHYDQELSATELLHNTDLALYESKKFKNNICIYDNSCEFEFL